MGQVGQHGGRHVGWEARTVGRRYILGRGEHTACRWALGWQVGEWRGGRAGTGRGSVCERDMGVGKVVGGRRRAVSL